MPQVFSLYPTSTAKFLGMHSLTSIYSRIPFPWWVVLITCAVGLPAICVRALQTEESRTKRTERNKKKELRSLAERISVYARTVHQRYPTGDVIVSERDLAEQLQVAPDFMFWPSKKHKFGWYLEPSYDYKFEPGHEHSLGVSGGLPITIP